MSKANDGGPASPVPAWRGEPELPKSGMSLRDWFAGQALVGYLTIAGMDLKHAIRLSWQAADSMLVEREAPSD